jgi:hypothetical protein
VVWTGLIWFRIWTSEYGNEPSGSVTRWEILEWLSDWQILKKGSAPWKASWRNRGATAAFIFLKGTEKTHKHLRMSGVLVEIRTQYLFNTNLERYRCGNVLGF